MEENYFCKGTHLVSQNEKVGVGLLNILQSRNCKLVGLNVLQKSEVTSPAYLIQYNNLSYIIEPPPKSRHSHPITFAERVKASHKKKVCSCTSLQRPSEYSVSPSGCNELQHEERVLTPGLHGETKFSKSIGIQVNSTPYLKSYPTTHTSVMQFGDPMTMHQKEQIDVFSSPVQPKDKIIVTDSKNTSSSNITLQSDTTPSCTSESYVHSSNKEWFKTATVKRKHIQCFNLNGSLQSQSISKSQSDSSLISSHTSQEAINSSNTSELPSHDNYEMKPLAESKFMGRSNLQTSVVTPECSSVKDENKMDDSQRDELKYSPNIKPASTKSQKTPTKKIKLEEYWARKSLGKVQEKSVRETENFLKYSATDDKKSLDKVSSSASGCDVLESHYKKLTDLNGKNHGLSEDFFSEAHSQCLQEEEYSSMSSNFSQVNFKEQHSLVSEALSSAPSRVSISNTSLGKVVDDGEEKAFSSPPTKLFDQIKKKVQELTDFEAKRGKQEKQTLLPTNASSSLGISRKVFYGQKSSTENVSRKAALATHDAFEDPVVLTLSSDEDDNDQKSRGSSSFPEIGKRALPDLKNEKDSLDDLDPQNKFSNFHGDGSSNKSECSSIGENGGNFLTLKCSTLFIGSYRVMNPEPVTLSTNCFKFVVPSLDKGQPITLLLKKKGIRKLLVSHEEELCAFVIEATPSMASYVRQHLKMNDPLKQYLNPHSCDETQKRILFEVDSVQAEYLSSIDRYFISEEDNYSSYGGRFLQHYPREKIKNLIERSRPTIPPPIFFGNSTKSGSRSERLFVFPPPPHPGGITITTDDYCCLEDEQFLNDVIIDFYLQWLMCHVSEADRERTHVFSTFFYKRLTTKPKKTRRLYSTEDDDSLSPAQKRHARVKSWTKNVDIFSKDFIFVPINEHSHWFLAVICFPGLDGPIRISDGKSVPRIQEQKPTASSRKPETKIEIPLLDASEASDRDEAEGDDEEFLEFEKDDEANSKKTKIRDESEKESSTSGSIKQSVENEQNSLEPIYQPCILIFDSLYSSDSSKSRIVCTLRDYLSVEYLRRKGVARVFSKETMKGSCPKVPQQMNFSDCGLFTLQFAQSFFERPIKNYQFPIRTLMDWFDQDLVSCKRKDIASLINVLMHKYSPDLDISLPTLRFNPVNDKLRSSSDSFSSRLFFGESEKDTQIGGQSDPEKQSKLKMSSSESSSSTSLDSHPPDPVEYPKEAKKIKITLCETSPVPQRPKTPTPLNWTSSSSPFVISDEEDSENGKKSLKQSRKNDFPYKESSYYDNGVFESENKIKFSSVSAFKRTEPNSSKDSDKGDNFRTASSITSNRVPNSRPESLKKEKYSNREIIRTTNLKVDKTISR